MSVFVGVNHGIYISTTNLGSIVLMLENVPTLGSDLTQLFGYPYKTVRNVGLT